MDKKEEKVKNYTETKTNFEALVDATVEELDDDHTAIDNQTYYNYIYGQIFRIEKYKMHVAKFSKKEDIMSIK